MARGWLDRMMVFFGFEADLPDEADEEIARQEQDTRVANLTERKTANGRRGPAVASSPRGRLVSLPGGDAPGTVVIVRPRSYDDVQEITDRLKHRHPVIVNLAEADPDAAQKIVNFLSGAVYALDGEMQRIGSGVLFFAPSNVNIERVFEEAHKPTSRESAT